jgi:formylglycine-generating enzyme required for sulfatase activity
MASIFLSYSRADRPKAQIIAEALSAEGFEVWWDKVLRAGETYDEVTETRLRDADAVIVLWSTVSVKSKWVRAEATLGQRTSVLIPAMIEEAERPIMFELTQSADLIGWEGDRSDPRWKAFVDDARGVIGKPAPAASSAPAAPAPDTTMELTFWTSIKDGDDAADFEAYLRRYPDGHYSDLARNRIAAIARKAAAAAPAPAPPPPPPPLAPPPPPPPPPPAAKPVAPPPKPAASAPPRPQPAPARAPAPAPAKKSGSSVPFLIGGLIAIVAAGYGVSQLLPGKPDSETVIESAVEEDVVQDIAAVAPPQAPVIEAGPPETPPVETASVPEPEPAPPEPVCEICPPLVSLPGGTFLMGSAAGESGREPIEGPQREVTVKPFSISKTEITVGQWRTCVEDGGCNGYRNPLTAEDAMPAAAISWKDAEAYVKWLSAETGKPWRLPTEAEWEYAARGGTATPYWWGERFDAAKAPRDKVREAASLPENTFGLQGMLGNVSEWTQDCYVNGYTDAPSDGSAVTSGDCSRRVVRGGSVKSSPSAHRAANRARLPVSTRDRQYGFRIVLSED